MLSTYRLVERNVTRFDYDGQGNVISISYPDNTSESFIRNPNGLVECYTDRNGFEFSYTYDEFGYIQTMQHVDGTVVYDCDEYGNVLTRTDEAGNLWTYGYTPDGRIEYAMDPLGNEEFWQYDNRKDLEFYTDARGIKTEYEYDDRHLLLEVRIQDGDVFSYTYRDDGNMETQSVNGVLTTRYDYDAVGRLSTVERLTTVEGVETWVTTSYEYHPSGQLEYRVDPRNFVTEYRYDAMDRLTDLFQDVGIDEGTGEMVRTLHRYGYDDAGRIDEVWDGRDNRTTVWTDPIAREIITTDPYDARTETVYDPYGRILQTTDPDLRSTSREYDFRGKGGSFKTPV